MKKIFFITLLVSLLACRETKQDYYYNTEKPWAYWWWHGSSVTKEGISANLKAYAGAGIGGLHIVPIYGVEGDDANFIDYLSPKWMEMLSYTVSEAEKQGMGIDITTGTGWPFGGPGITNEYSAQKTELKKVDLSVPFNANTLTGEKNSAKLVCLSALNDGGSCEDITSLVEVDGTLKPSGKTYKKGYALIMNPTGQMVKRAAPGGEGLVMDYFSREALDYYFKRFDEAFGNTYFPLGEVRAFYNDSYEVINANFTGNLLKKFEELRNYKLENYLHVVADTLKTEMKERIVSDYCETISDLLYNDFTKNWVEKSHGLGMLTREQAHGSPGNILDLYGEADIPETESFGPSGFNIPGLRVTSEFRGERPDPLMMKFASSAAHIKGRQLVSSETATWLDDHFKVSLSQVKPQVDELFTAGINHIFYHGITYNPPGRQFPGRLFYASTNFGTRSHFWDELPALNSYIEYCQSILQNTQPLNDVLIYFPVYDLWAQRDFGDLIPMQVHNTEKWLSGTSFGEIVGQLWGNGFTFDYASDRMLAGGKAENGLVQFESGATYKTVVIPECRYIPEKTMEELSRLAKEGAKLIFYKSLPEKASGFSHFKEKQDKLELLKKEIVKQITVVQDIEEGLLETGILNEGLSESGLSFIRKQGDDGTVYFVTNLSDRFRNGKVRLATKCNYIEIYDPLNGNRGIASSEETGNGTELLLNLEPGQSCFLFCKDKKSGTGDWPYYAETGNEPLTIKTNWTITPVSGGPELPSPVRTDSLKSWISFGNDWQIFGGKAVYSAEIKLDKGYLDGPVRLDLGDIHETAKVTINGRDLGLLWCIPYKIIIPPGTLKKENRIEIEVTNLSFNRILDLDKRGVAWKNYYNTEFVDINYKPFDTSDKNPVASGLLNDIRLLKCSK